VFTPPYTAAGCIVTSLPQCRAAWLLASRYAVIIEWKYAPGPVSYENRNAMGGFGQGLDQAVADLARSTDYKNAHQIL
jgi:hypothetical protein